MISGTSKNSLNLGPINGQTWTRGPHIYCLYYTKILQKILEIIWEHPGNILFCKVGNRKIRQFSKVCVPFLFIYFLNISFVNYILRRWGMENDKIPFIKSTKAWIWISYLSKKHEIEISNFSIFKQGNHRILNSR